MQIKQTHITDFDNCEIIKYSLVADNGFQVDVLNYGGIITGVWTLDKNGNLDNVVLNYDNFSDYITNIGYFGAIVGRHAGRIGGGKFSIDGTEYQLECNRLGNSLHGGKRGLDKRVWDVVLLSDGIKLSYLSPHMQEMFPGNIQFEVAYRIASNNSLSIEYTAIPDRKTLINLTNHTSFNLSGGNRLASTHQLYLNAEQFCTVDETGLFKGVTCSVKDTPFDFCIPKIIDRDINQDHPQLKIVSGGYDHPFILSKNDNCAAKLVDLTSGRNLTVFTTESALVFYSGNFLTPGGAINHGHFATKHLGICLETQNIPNAINVKGITNQSLYTKEQPYSSKTTWVFGLE
jgi:aldose 1-epimerase